MSEMKTREGEIRSEGTGAPGAATVYAVLIT